MLSRAAENLYWMARHLERAENTARLINATTHMLLDLPRGASFGWNVLVQVVGLDNAFNAFYPVADEISVMRFLIEDENNPSSILSCVRRARENTRTLRELLPREAWERVNALYLFVNRSSTEAIPRSQRHSTLNELIERCQSVIGMLVECMSHDVAYQFIGMGRHLERADMTTRIVDISSAVLIAAPELPQDPFLSLLWMGVLKSLNAYQMYRRHVSVQIRATDVVRYLLRDPLFPRTVHYCLAEVAAALETLPHHDRPLASLRSAQQRNRLDDIDSLSSALRHQHLDGMQSELAQLHDAIVAEYFHFSAARQPGSPQGPGTGRAD
jgi:uncharacterized alpha-E superfamily protein